MSINDDVDILAEIKYSLQVGTQSCSDALQKLFLLFCGFESNFIIIQFSSICFKRKASDLLLINFHNISY